VGGNLFDCTIGLPETGLQGSPRVIVRPHDTDITVEKIQRVIIARDENRAAPEKSLTGRNNPFFKQGLPNQAVNPFNPGRALPEGAQNPESVEPVEGLPHAPGVKKRIIVFNSRFASIS
jgi:hypothetical protein